MVIDGPKKIRTRIVVGKWCYFPELYKMTEVREEGIENGFKEKISTSESTCCYFSLNLGLCMKLAKTNINSYV